MSLFELAVSDLRCIEDAELEVPPGLTLISCGSGSGETSLLEAILLIARGRSLRIRYNECLIQRGKDHLCVIGGVGAAGEAAQTLGFGASPATTVARIEGGSAVPLAEDGRTCGVRASLPTAFRPRPADRVDGWFS